MKNRYWRSLKDNWPIMMPATLGLIMGITIIFSYIKAFSYTLEHMESEPIMVAMFGIVFVMSFVRILSWLGFDMISKWADKFEEAISK